MSKLLILVDYENFGINANTEYKLEVLDKGIDKLISSCLNHGTLTNKKDLIVSAIWDNFRREKAFFATRFAEILDVYERGSNVSDGYLIVKAMNVLNEFKENDQIVIVAGDGVYTGLIRHCLSLGLKVHVYSWKNCTSKSLKINDDVIIHELEDVFEFSSDKHLKEGWFSEIGISQSEYAIITHALKPEFPHFFKVATANVIYQNTKDERYRDIDTYEKAFKFLTLCETNSIFISKRIPNPEKENKMQIAYTLNYDNIKVLKITSKKC